jgi:hypothetical protein
MQQSPSVEAGGGAIDGRDHADGDAAASDGGLHPAAAAVGNGWLSTGAMAVAVAAMFATW